MSLKLFPISIKTNHYTNPNRVSLQFGNDMSRIVRGLAIILMVCGHTLPGKIIGFAVPLFSFLVGYGYQFSKSKGYSNSFSRIWHLLSNFWFILFAICLPTALFTWKGTVEIPDLILNMFGLSGTLNFFCWYIYFYIAAMLLMPILSPLIDHKGWRSAILISIGFGIIAFLLDWAMLSSHSKELIKWLNIPYRIARYMPVVVAGYWLAHFKILSRISLNRHWATPLLCIVFLIAIYFTRGLWNRALQTFDLIWAPAAAIFIASIFNLYPLKWLRLILTELGMKSMGIWFLHALFFSFSTRNLFLPLIKWIPIGPLRILPILIISYILALCVDKSFQFLSQKLSKMMAKIPTPKLPSLKF